MNTVAITCLRVIFPSVFKNFYGPETALVRECNYVIIDIDRNKTVIVNTAPKFGNSKFGKEVLKEIKRKLESSPEKVAVYWLLYQSYTHGNSPILKTENTLSP